METGNVKRRRASHHEIYTDILIDAAPAVVWEVVTDTASYKNWAPFMVAIKGTIRDGNTITVDFQVNPAKEKLFTIDHKISVTDGQEFFWAEKGPMGICDNHHFRVEPTEDGKARFVQSDELTKGMTWLLGGYLSRTYLAGYQAFNRALKAEAERRAAA